MKTKTQYGQVRENDKTGHEIKLELISGPMDGLEFALMKNTVTIGREKNQDVPLLLDVMISRFHAQIIYEGEDWWLQDMGSTNGTFIEKRIIEGKVQLPVGNVFTVGSTEIRRIY